MALVPRGLCCKGARILIQPALLSRLSNGTPEGRLRYPRHVNVQRFRAIQHLGMKG
jgi:hypothetical protein